MRRGWGFERVEYRPEGTGASPARGRVRGITKGPE